MEVEAVGSRAGPGRRIERIQGREHFPSDVLVGGAIGYLVGGYIFDHHSSRSKTHVAFAPIVGRGGAGISLRISRGDSQ